MQESGICPVTIENRLIAVHGGMFAGRACWVIAGTFCGGEIQGSFTRKQENCMACDFYELVRKEEAPHFLPAARLLKKLRE